MSEPLTAFAPRRCVDSGLIEHGGAMVQDATVLFLDLAGFTPLTHRLEKLGSRGTEELSRLLRRFFGQVTDAVLDLGGDPIAFGGDALTIVFDGSPELTVEAASHSAAAIRRLAEGTAATPTTGGPVTLEARIGIARGPVTSAVAQSTRRSIPVHLGPGLDLAVAAEAQADPGQVVVDPSAAPRGSAVLRVDHLRPPLDHGLVGRNGSDSLTRLVHPVVLNRLTEGRALLESHRSVTVGFVRFPPVEHDELPRFLGTAGDLLELVDGLGGELIQVSGGDKGVVAMAVFGAPVAHADDPLRAVQTMLELRRREPAAAIGVATGSVFAALLGSDRRRFPAHSGQAVNLAARLMQSAAPGQLIAETTTWQAGSKHLRRDGPPVVRLVKGREEPVETHAVAGWRRGRRRTAAPADPPLVGREAELNVIERFLDDIVAGTGRLLTIVGDPGVGKSRMVRELVQRATTRGASVVLVDTDEHPWGQSTGLWRDLVGGLTGIPPRSRRTEWFEALKACLPDVAAQIPVLGPLLGIRLGDLKTHTSLPPDLQAELVQALVGRLVVAAAAERPLLLVVENAHHLDQGSKALLENVGRVLPGTRAGLLVTRRADDNRMPEPGGGEELRIGELTRSEVALLAGDVWRQSGGGSPPPWLPMEVRRRAGGNPLFVGTVTEMLREHWEPGQPPPSADFAAASLAGLLAERVDQLPVGAHELLSVLAVVRQPCSLAVAGSLLVEPRDERTTALTASKLAAEHLVQLATGETGIRCRLLHDVLQQVVYQSMSHSERLRLHRRLAEHLSDSGSDPIEVAEHVARLDDLDLARHWFPRAAASARATWNFPRAVGWWRRALPLLSGQARDEAEVELLELLLVAGRANEVLAATSVAAQLTPDLSARRLHAVAEAALVCGALDRSESAAVEAMRITEDVDEARHQRAAELLVLARCARGDIAGARTTAQQQLERAKRVGDLRAVSTAHASLGAALLHAGLSDSAVEHYDEARLGAIALGDVVLEVHVLSDLAGCAFETGRYEDCVHLLARARTAADTIGYQRHLAFNLSNEAQLRSALGDARATACAAVALQRSLEMGDLTAAANSLHTWVTSEPAIMTDPDHWHRLHAIDSHLGRESVVAADAADLAVAAARRGRTADAFRAADEAAEAAKKTDQVDVLRRATLGRLIAEFRSTPASEPSRVAVLVAGLRRLAAGEGVSDVEQAELGLERWRATRRPRDRKAAVDLLRRAFDAEPSAIVRHWFNEIGEPQPEPPAPLPPPVGIGHERTTRAELEVAFHRMEAALGSVRCP